MNPIASITEALEDLRLGKLLIVVDGPERENEGDFFIPAERIEPAHINTMITHGRGLVCVPITEEQAANLSLPLMVPLHENSEITQVNFTVSVNARYGGSGISAFDRARTIQVLSDHRSQPHELTKPGHIFPLIARAGGLAERQGHTEAAITLAQLSGHRPAGVLCEIIHHNGHMARMPELINLAQALEIKIITIADLISFTEQQPVGMAVE